MAQGTNYGIISPFGPGFTGSTGTLAVTGSATVTGNLNVGGTDTSNGIVTGNIDATSIAGRFFNPLSVNSDLAVAGVVSATAYSTTGVLAAGTALITGAATVTGTLFAAGINAGGGGIMNLRDSINPTTAATVTLALADSGEIFTNDTAGAQVSFILPTSPSFGTSYGFINTSPTQNIKVAAGGSDKIQGVGGATKTIATSNTQYQVCKLVFVNTNAWLAIYNTGFTGN